MRIPTSPRSAAASDFLFIGPPHDAIRKLGLKTEAKAIATAAKVPVVPGSDGPVASDAEAAQIARAAGYPVLIKAAAGGGGKGMRICREESQLLNALQSARNEAEAAFKNPSVYIEKFIDRPRHVEVQILADTHGKVLHFWERDCSLQRRHQKLVEESPAPTLPDKVRRRMCEAAVRLAKTVGYVNAGTVEFLVDADFNFYFIEVNTRIQVEHPVTEMVTGFDLVKWQIRIAAGEPLPFSQADIPQVGHAIECRINCRGPRPQLPPLSRPHHRHALPRRPRRPFRDPRPPRLRRAAKLRLDGRQARRPRPQPRRGAPDNEPRPR